MSRSTIQAQIIVILGTVTGIGKIYDRVRYTKNLDDFKDVFVDSNDKVNVCMVSRETTKTQRRSIGEVEHAHVFKIRFIYAVDDANDSESAFQTILDSAITKFLADTTLNGTADTTEMDWGPLDGQVALQIDPVEFRRFSNVLCHYAEGLIAAEEGVSG